MLVSCHQCHKEFDRFPKDIKRCKRHFCNISCLKEFHARIKTQCAKCNNSIFVTRYRFKSSKNHFCGRSCSISYHNKHSPKRKRLRKCKTCSSKILSGYTYCPQCIEQKRHIKNPFDETRSLAHYISLCSNSNRYRYVRQHARQKVSLRPQVCSNCGYDKHVETSHIKPVADFPSTATIAEVNANSNLILFCRNCHWEFDHKLLKLGSVGFEPTTLIL